MSGVAVTNRSPRIAPDEMPHLFSRLYRSAAARSSGVAGLGLGLYITQELVRAHGGAVFVESVPDEATTFRFTLPMSQAEEAAERFQHNRQRREENADSGGRPPG